jgi:hypothetical protein
MPNSLQSEPVQGLLLPRLTSAPLRVALGVGEAPSAAALIAQA